MKRIFALILCVLMVLTCIFVTSCSPENENTDNSSTGEDENENGGPVFVDNVPDVATLEGTPMVSNVAYKMARSGMVFAVPTVLSETANEGITLVATVEPSYATKTAVDWSVSFANPESEWATGKTVTDYVKITPTAIRFRCLLLSFKNANRQTAKKATICPSAMATSLQVWPAV